MSEQTIDYAKGIVHEQNASKIKEVLNRAQNGEEITVGFLGGSITQGCLSSTPETCYAYLSYKWWKDTFPDSKINYVNAGIGGTTSQFGVARVDDDLLKYNPDFVIVEFSVNDDNTPFFQETYEGLLRHIMRSEKSPAILIVNSVFWEDGHNAQEIHDFLGKYYEIPCVSVKNGIYQQVANGQMKQVEVTTDGLHPNDLGHQLMANQITYYLQLVKDNQVAIEMNRNQMIREQEDNGFEVSDKDYHSSIKENDIEKTIDMKLDCKSNDFINTLDIIIKDPITINGYELSKRYQNTNSTPVCEGFTADKQPQENIRDIFKHGWQASELHSKIKFKLEGTGIAIQYRKTIHKPTPIAKVIVDGKEEWSKVLDGNFEETWGDCLYIDTICQHIDYAEHEVEVELVETHNDDQVPFYLVSVIATC